MNLVKKYNVAGPRYTSYPTVPYWDSVSPTEEEWKKSVKFSFDETNAAHGISIYIHLPFCESLCTYCGCNTRITVNHSVEHIYIDAVLNEWKLYLEVFKETPRIKAIHLGGGTPTFFSPANLNKLITGILSQTIICDNPEFSFEAHPNNTTAEHLKTLFELGFTRLSLGIQDFDPKVQAIVNRIQSFENVEKVVTEARKIGYSSINFDLIYGLPLQTRESVIDTISKVNLLKPDRIAYYSYAHVPWIKPGQRKFTEKDLPANEEKRALYETGKELFSENGYVEIGMDHFALKTDSLYKAVEESTLHRNFMGYTHSYTKLMIGLGVSSISDTWNAYAQNVKTIEKYYELVGKKQIPVFKGHSLSDEDLVLRKHILNIICKFKTSWKNPDEQCQAVYDAIERLAEIEKDNLIELRHGNLEVKKAARPFVRNICMAFDAKLWRNVPQAQIFSSVI
ncbi:MAG: oxygen-independent coproporphyrinogen III oxidase [Bacteroidota bacterium]|nr:oxygen-independent coproporphyrinogen III oxidase [Bacteroidota bacterium]